MQQSRETLRAVQVQLSETSNLYIAQGDKLREVRRSRLELDQENTTLKTTLSRTKVRYSIHLPYTVSRSLYVYMWEGVCNCLHQFKM